MDLVGVRKGNKVAQAVLGRHVQRRVSLRGPFLTLMRTRRPAAGSRRARGVLLQFRREIRQVQGPGLR